MLSAIDRISPIMTLLDEVFYQSSIQDMRSAYFQGLAHFTKLIVVSDYYLGSDKTNKVVTFTALPLAGDLPQLQSMIKNLAPQDIKHTQTIDYRFIELLRQLPIINISFIFQQEKYLAWNNSNEFQDDMTEYCEILTRYIAFWRKGALNQIRMDKLS